MGDGFDIEKSNISAAQLATFLSSEVNENLLTVPGIGPEAVRLLAVKCKEDSPIETTHQLIGRFLTLRCSGMTSAQHLNAFWFYLKLKGIKAYRSGIVGAIAEKVNIMIPHTYSLEPVQEEDSDSNGYESA